MTKHLTLLLFIGLAWGQATIAVFDLENNGLKDSEVRILTDRLQSELVKVGGYTVVERKKIEKVFAEQKFQMSGCVEECLIEVGVLLGAKEIVIGSVGRFGSIYTVSARLVNATTGEMIQSTDYDSNEGISSLLTVGMEEIARDLANNTDTISKPKSNNKSKKYINSNSAIERARAAKLAADKAAAEAAAATEAAIEAAAKRSADRARKQAGYIKEKDQSIYSAGIIAAEEARMKMIKELGLRRNKLEHSSKNLWWSNDNKYPEPKIIEHDNPPVALSPVSPKYPEIAQEAGIEGTVVLQAFINKKGKATSIKVLEGVPNTGFDQASIDAIRKTKFKPAKKGWKSIGVWIYIPIYFELK